MTDELNWMPAVELAQRIRNREVSPVEATEAALAQLEAVEPAINAFVTVTADLAREAAERAERAVMTTPADELGLLHGVPVSVKDLTDTAGVRTTYGARPFRDNVPDTDGVAWARMKAAGAVLIGKTTTPEFGMLGFTESQLTGRTSTPWDPAMISGGSSGGAAASMAAGVGALAWGSDGGGSIRVPAACCGVVGHKASPGRIPFLSNDLFETAGVEGPITRTVADAALLLEVTGVPHPHDPRSLPAEPAGSFLAATRNASVAGLRIAYAPHFGTGRIAKEVSRVVGDAVQVFAGDLGATVEQVEMTLPDPIAYFLDYWMGGAASELGEFLAIPGFDPETDLHPATRKLLAAAPTEPGAYARAARTTRTAIFRAFATVFDDHDLILTPTMPVTAFPHPGAEGGNTEIDGLPIDTEWACLDFHRLTEPPSHAALPALSLNCGFSDAGLPVGLQIIGPPRADAAVLRGAAAYEAATPWHTMRPPVAS